MEKPASSKLYEVTEKYLPDLIYGANDGVVTTVAVIAGVTGAALSREIILILGFANLAADGFSMAASNVLSQRSRAETVSLKSASRNGLATFIGFVIVGLVPLFAYILPDVGGQDRFALAVVLGLGTLFVVGASRAAFTLRGWLRAGLEMFLLGAVAAAVAYGVGLLAARLTGFSS